MVVGAVTGLFVCNGPVLGLTFGVFLKPITADMGWTRGTASAPLSAGPITSALAVPVLGYLMDRLGIRRVALPGLVIYAVFLCLLGLLPHSLPIFTLLVALAGMTSAIQTPLGYAKAISAWFDRRRGLALGVAMSGVGLGAFVIPQLARAVIDRFGWRGAYVVFGLLTLAIACPAVALWIREPRPGEGERRVHVAAAALPGLSVREAATTGRFWIMGGTFFLVAVAINGTVAHVVPLLTDDGLSGAAATATLAVFGLATLSGRLLAGWLVDRSYAPYVASLFFLAPIAGLIFLASAAGALPVVGVALMGLGLGTETDLIAFLITCYFGQCAFGQIYGYFFMIFGLGSGVGPFRGGVTYDRAGSYNPSLIGAAFTLVIAVVLVNCLGIYIYPADCRVEPDLAPEPAAP